MSKKIGEQSLLKYEKLYNWGRTLITSGVIQNEDKFPSENILQKKFGYSRQTNVTKLAPSEKVKIGTRTAHSATEQRLCAVFLKKGMTRKRIEKSAKKSYSKRINYATL